MKTCAAVAALLAATLGMGVSPAHAQAQAQPQDKGRTWPEIKCSRYSEAWSEAVRRKGTKGLGEEFLKHHDAFIASGCTSGEVCPRSPDELAMANILVMAAFNAGMGSTFMPFKCRK